MCSLPACSIAPGSDAGLMGAEHHRTSPADQPISIAAVMDSLPADLRHSKLLPFLKQQCQSPDLDEQVARCLAEHFAAIIEKVTSACFATAECSSLLSALLRGHLAAPSSLYELLPCESAPGVLHNFLMHMMQENDAEVSFFLGSYRELAARSDVQTRSCCARSFAAVLQAATAKRCAPPA